MHIDSKKLNPIQAEFEVQLDIVIRKKSSKKLTVVEEWVSEKEMRDELKWSPSFRYKKVYRKSLRFFHVLQVFIHPFPFASKRIPIPKVADPRSKEVVWSQTCDTHAVTTLYMLNHFLVLHSGMMDGGFNLYNNIFLNVFAWFSLKV